MIKCSSPTCTATVGILSPASGPALGYWLERVNWALEQHANDDEPVPYCPRDKDDAG